jgi:hypothetical protein
MEVMSVVDAIEHPKGLTLQLYSSFGPRLQVAEVLEPQLAQVFFRDARRGDRETGNDEGRRSLCCERAI